MSAAGAEPETSGGTAGIRADVCDKYSPPDLPCGKIKTRHSKRGQDRQNASCQQHAQSFSFVERCDFGRTLVISKDKVTFCDVIRSQGRLDLIC
jgi:hypothetical protein